MSGPKQYRIMLDRETYEAVEKRAAGNFRTMPLEAAYLISIGIKHEDNQAMNHAIAQLQTALENALQNAPFWDAEGNTQEANFCRERAADYAKAILLLKAQPGGREADSESSPC